mmetsp:Transcript_33528/g.34023  ORF Transcript_33528/g.34023 Transcript_33528/m.34023 type:complete len:253 (+) Transcript_33528:78-836(+)
MEAVTKNVTEFMNAHEDKIIQVKTKIVETKTKVEQIVMKNKEENPDSTNESTVIDEEPNVDDKKTLSFNTEDKRDDTESNQDYESSNTESKDSKDTIEKLKRFAESFIQKIEKVVNEISDKEEVRKVADPLTAKLMEVRTKLIELKDGASTQSDDKKDERKSKEPSDNSVVYFVATAESNTKKALVSTREALQKAASKVGIFDNDANVANKTDIKERAGKENSKLSLTNNEARSRRFSINDEEDTYPETDVK